MVYLTKGKALYLCGTADTTGRVEHTVVLALNRALLNRENQLKWARGVGDSLLNRIEVLRLYTVYPELLDYHEDMIWLEDQCIVKESPVVDAAYAASLTEHYGYAWVSEVDKTLVAPLYRNGGGIAVKRIETSTLDVHSQDILGPHCPGYHIWYAGHPPHIGWWNASLSENLDPDEWRWWNGTEWSSLANFGYSARDAETSTLYPANKEVSILWTYYWPENARVPRTNPDATEQKQQKGESVGDRT